jgi:Ca2+-binding RTX toxin-like protein
MYNNSRNLQLSASSLETIIDQYIAREQSNTLMFTTTNGFTQVNEVEYTGTDNPESITYSSTSLAARRKVLMQGGNDKGLYGGRFIDVSMGEGNDQAQLGADNIIINGNNGDDIIKILGGSDVVAFGGQGSDIIISRDNSVRRVIYGNKGDYEIIQPGNKATVVFSCQASHDLTGCGQGVLSYLDSNSGVVINLTELLGSPTLLRRSEIKNLIPSLVEQSGSFTMDLATEPNGKFNFWVADVLNLIDLNSEQSYAKYNIVYISSVQHLIGSNHADELYAKQLVGSIIKGLDGDDLIVGNSGLDILDGGSGVNTIDYGWYTGDVNGNGVVINLLTQRVSGGPAEGDIIKNFQNASGSKAKDTLTANDTGSRLRGWDGDDILNGGLGNDVLLGDGGNDIIYGNNGNDEIRGGQGNDRLFGNDGQDTIYGDAGDDIISGGDGNNTLWGGTGKDTFIITASQSTQIIKDFETSVTEIIDLSAFGGVISAYHDLVITDYSGGTKIDVPLNLAKTSYSTILLEGVSKSQISNAHFTPQLPMISPSITAASTPSFTPTASFSKGVSASTTSTPSSTISAGASPSNTPYLPITSPIMPSIEGNKLCLELKKLSLGSVGDLDRTNEEIELEISTGAARFSCGLYKFDLSSNQKDKNLAISVPCSSGSFVDLRIIERDNCNDDLTLRKIPCGITTGLQAVDILISSDSTSTSNEQCRSSQHSIQACGNVQPEPKIGGSFCYAYSWGTEECGSVSVAETTSEYILEYSISDRICPFVSNSSRSDNAVCYNAFYQPGPVCNTGLRGTSNADELSIDPIYGFIAGALISSMVMYSSEYVN